MISIVMIVFILLLAIGVPIAFVLGLSSLLYLWIGEIPLVLLSQRFFVGIDSFLLLAVPLFVLAGKLMNETGITDRLINFFIILMGHIRGGLAYITIITSVFFSGITGTGAADAAAIGSILIPAMIKEGYKADYAAAITAVAAVIGPTIPPSVAMVVYGASAGVSVAKMFLGGIVPGLLIATVLMFVVWRSAKNLNVPVRERQLTLSSFIKGFFDATLALFMPFIMIGGVIFGIFTPTEAAGVSVLYSAIIGFFIYHRLTLRNLLKQIYDTALITGTILVIIAFANLFGWILAAEDIPGVVARAIIRITDNPFIILLMINILFLIVGCFMETLASVVLLTPILLPLAIAIGLDPVHFGIIMVVNLNIGLVTPPVGVCLFVASPIANVPIEKIFKAAIPFVVAMIGVLLLITYIPDIAMFIPKLFLK